ncbi:DUF5955 family protein [Actinomadura sp. HBU206391]|uniref:DUF5955 family protein n=1 Tax=Actinomadura sp. HBU206391 TaxID=2731692 RepID=UPI00164F35D4|nr:DUF5955 family protein [Actinomadura sp. HBU206391]MBC6460340.1 hypothetical protein [Actinomadura sp. HBU206391]
MDAGVLGRVARLGGTSPEVVDALDRLERLLGRHEGSLAEPVKARRDLADIREEAGQRDRDDGRLADALRRLAARVTAVGVLAEAVRQLGVDLRA